MAGNFSDWTHTLVSRRQKKKKKKKERKKERKRRRQKKKTAKKLAKVIQNRKQHALWEKINQWG